MADDFAITQAEIEAAASEFRNAIVDENTLFLEEVDGRKEFLVFDGDTVRMVVKEDTVAIEEACKALFNEPIDRRSEFRRIASFPPSVLQIWGREKYGLTDSAWYFDPMYSHLVIEAAHDRDLAVFRTAPGEYRRRTR